MTPPSHIIKILTGSWYLLNMTSYRNGTETPGDQLATGAHPIGLIHYTPTGYMSANIMTTNPAHRPLNITYPAKEGDLDSDWAQLGRHTLTYAGPFSATVWNETHGALIHGPLIYAGTQDWVGSEQKRNYSLWEGGNVLRLQAQNATSGGNSYLWWRRLGPSWDNGTAGL